jgi:hypothetical protein
MALFFANKEHYLMLDSQQQQKRTSETGNCLRIIGWSIAPIAVVVLGVIIGFKAPLILLGIIACVLVAVIFFVVGQVVGWEQTFETIGGILEGLTCCLGIIGIIIVSMAVLTGFLLWHGTLPGTLMGGGIALAVEIALLAVLSSSLRINKEAKPI